MHFFRIYYAVKKTGIVPYSSTQASTLYEILNSSRLTPRTSQVCADRSHGNHVSQSTIINKTLINKVLVTHEIL